VKPRTRDAIGLTLALAAALAAHRFVLDLELMGWDTYPTIAASRIRDLGDLWGSFTEKLMDERYPAGSFYRPVTNLFFALARRWLGPGAAPWVAALTFALHPLQLETVPVAARRADMLFSVFLCWALIAQPLGSRRPRRAIALGALWVLFSAASKETSFPHRATSVTGRVECCAAARSPRPASPSSSHCERRCSAVSVGTRGPPWGSACCAPSASSRTTFAASSCLSPGAAGPPWTPGCSSPSA
jgi:hypothetical protein